MQRFRKKTARRGRGRPETSLVPALNHRSLTGDPRGTKLWAEDESVFRHDLEYLDLAEDTTRSTIAVAFSNDGKLLASTHGDHTVKITSFLRGKVVQTLRGHPRTPWTVKFHPTDSNIVASGCLDFEVRVWNVATGQCLHSSKLGMAIISLSFHPSGHMLAVASGQSVYFWDHKNKPEPYVVWSHAHSLRCVRFTPDGTGIIVGAANNGPPQPRENNQGAPRGSAREATSGAARGAAAGRGAAGGRAVPTAPAQALAPGQSEVTFRLQVWDFSLDAALAENGAAAMTRPRVLLHQALLYNDGGFDVSQDGLWLCVIAELWKVTSDPAAVKAAAAAAAAVVAVAAARPSSSSSSSSAARAGDGESTATAVAEAAGAPGARAARGGQSSSSFSSAVAATAAAAAAAPVAAPVAAGGGDASLTAIPGRERPVASAAAASAAGLVVVPGDDEESFGASLSRWRGTQGDAPRAEGGREWELARPAGADDATKMEVDVDADVEVGAGVGKVAGVRGGGAEEVLSQGWAKRYAGATAAACEESGGKERGLSAPRHGSQLGRDQQSLSVGMAAAAAAAAAAPPSLPQKMLAVATPAAEGRTKARAGGGGGAGGDSSDGQWQWQTERGEGSGEGRASLAPWPSRVRPRRYFSSVWGEEHVVGSGIAAVAAAAGAGGRLGGANQARQPGNELSPPPPQTPSPRISLKRRMSSPWGGSAGSRGGGGGIDGFLGRKRQGTVVPKTGTMGRVAEVEAPIRTGVDSGGAGAGSGGGSSSSGVDGGRNVRHSPVGLEVRVTAKGGAEQQEEEEEEEEERRSPSRDTRGGGRELARQEGDRPPPLPPPPPPIIAHRELSSPSLSSSSSSSLSLSLSLSLASSTAPLRPLPLPISAAPLSEGLQAPPSSSSLLPLLAMTSRGGGGGASFFSPPAAALLGPAAAAAAATATDGGRLQLQTGAGRAGETGRRGGAEPLQLPPPPPPIFFLQVPGGVAATTNEEGLGLCPPLSGAAGEASVAHGVGGGASAAGEGEEEGSPAERGVGRRRCLGEEGGCSSSSGSGIGSGSGAGSGSGSSGGSGSGAGRIEQPSGGDITRAASGDGRRRVLLPPPPQPAAGKFVPHLVLVSLNADGKRGKAARVVRAAAMDSLSAKQVTSVKLSPSARYILLGAGVLSERTRREPRPVASSDGPGGGGGGSVAAPRAPPVTSIYSASTLRPVSLMSTADDDVNIACFHPEPGMGCAYGTKQGRVSLVRMAD